MRITNDPTFNPHPIFGSQPHIFHGSTRPDATGVFDEKGVGTLYVAHLTDNQSELFVKAKNDGRADDWFLQRGVISQRLTLTDFTDGGAAAGTAELNGTIPAGAVYLRSFLYNVEDAATVTTLTVQIGDGDDGTDDDRYNTGTPSVAAEATTVDAGAPSGAVYHATAVTPVVTVTEDDDFTDVTTLGFTVEMTYHGAVL